MRWNRTGRLVTAITLAFGTAVATAPAAGAAPAAAWGWWRPPAPYTYYLSLGDSLGFGYSDANLATFEAGLNDGESPEDAAATAFLGYTQQVAASLPSSVSAVENLSCPGETTGSMLAGPCPADTLFPQWWPYHGSSQIDAAAAFLDAHSGERGVITVSIGANDVLGVMTNTAACQTNPACPELTSAVGTMRNNLKTILRTLRHAAPTATIVVLTPYNPLGHALPLTDIAAAGVNLTIAFTALTNGARVADAFTPINVQHHADFDCGNLVYYCASPADTDIHPTAAGYAVIADAIEAVLR